MMVMNSMESLRHNPLVDLVHILTTTGHNLRIVNNGQDLLFLQDVFLLGYRGPLILPLVELHLPRVS